MIVVETFIPCESISVQCALNVLTYWMSMAVVVDQLGTCLTMGSIVLSLWVQRPLLFVPYYSLSGPIAPNISLTTAPASDWCTEFFAISKISTILFVFREPSFQPLPCPYLRFP